MANKKKKNIKKQENDEIETSTLIWMIISVLLVVLFIFSLNKTGVVGIFFHNLFSYIFSNVYYIPIISIFIYGIYAIFIKKNHKLRFTIILGIILLNLAAMILMAVIQNELLDFNDLSNYIHNGFNNLSSTTFEFGGGVIGYFFYILFKSMFDRIGSIVLLVVLTLIAILIMIPKSLYLKSYASLKERHELNKIEREKQKELEALEELNNEEEFDLDHKEEIEFENPKEKKSIFQRLFNFEDEEDELIENNEEEIIDTPSEVIKEISPTIEEEEDDDMYSDSPYFITLDRPKKVTQNNNEEIIEEVHQEESHDEPVVHRVNTHKVRKKTGAYHYPDYRKLENSDKQSTNENKVSALEKGSKLIEILDTFGIQAELVNTHIGPTVTKFEVKPESSVKVDRINNIANNIKMELAVKDIRIEAPIPGRSAVGIEIPNKIASTVKMKDLMANMPSNAGRLTFGLGKDLLNENVYCDLSKMPHMLIAGATGSGKSVCINTIICSFLFKANPDEIKLILIDPKKVEFTPYHDIPHLLWPVITDTQMACFALQKATVIMEERYEIFSEAGVRNIQTYNEYVDKYNMDLSSNETRLEKMPYIVIIIDELADLMMMAKKEVQASIQRITQLARACGIHLIVATQRPSVDVITGVIKSNIPSRISFAVTSVTDSRTILDRAGAERLLGYGDMLYLPQGDPAPTRIQGCFITDNEVKMITEYVKSQADPAYDDSYYELEQNMRGGNSNGNGGSNSSLESDALYEEVVEYVTEAQKASTSLLQRRFGIGYNRAARLIDTLEENGVIGPAQGSKPRTVYRKKDNTEDELV